VLLIIGYVWNRFTLPTSAQLYKSLIKYSNFTRST
jgi:hypothetical protein